MITIRSSAEVSGATLICVDATLETPSGSYGLSSDGPLAACNPCRSREGLNGLSWPQSRFQLARNMTLEQQIFLPNDDSAAAFSWQLRGPQPWPVRLVITPFFAGCGPRTYRDVGFRLQCEDAGGPLAWLPNVLGPKIIADTNGAYREETAFLGDLVSPGTFEFSLSHTPSVLILTQEASAGAGQQMGAFLAGLMPRREPVSADYLSLVA